MISDVHLDPWYHPAASTACFCRAQCNAPRSSSGRRVYGQPGCDSPLALLDHILTSAAAIDEHPDLVLMLGDAMAHHLKNFPGTEGMVFANVTAKIMAAFPAADGKCAVVLGNNDVMPDYSIRLSEADRFWRHAEAVKASCALSEVAYETLRRGGYYAQDIEGVRIVVLNTGPYSREPRAPPLDVAAHPDPYGQFAWLEEEVEHAASSGTRLLIIGHAPPVLDYYDRMPIWQEAYSSRFWALLRRRPSVVGGLLFGHMHTTQYRVWSGASPTSALARAPPLVALPAVSPIFGNNPGFSLLTLDGTDGYRLGDVRTYYAELPSRSADEQGPPAIKPLFDTADPGAFAAQSFARSSEPPLLLSNAHYARLAASMSDVPFRTELGEATWQVFHAAVAANGSMTSDRSCTSDAWSDEVGDCKVCERGCRTAWVCLLLDGLSRDDYSGCLHAVQASGGDWGVLSLSADLPGDLPRASASQSSHAAAAAVFGSVALWALALVAYVAGARAWRRRPAKRDEHVSGDSDAVYHLHEASRPVGP